MQIKVNKGFDLYPFFEAAYGSYYVFVTCGGGGRYVGDNIYGSNIKRFPSLFYR